MARLPVADSDDVKGDSREQKKRRQEILPRTEPAYGLDMYRMHDKQQPGQTADDSSAGQLDCQNHHQQRV